LNNRLTDAVRRFRSRKRDAGLEVSLHKSLEDSSELLEQLLLSDGRAPHEQTNYQEKLLKLSDALAQLTRDQRVAVEYRHLHGLSVEEIARRMDRSKQAVGGLLRRGMRQLREILNE